MWYFFRQKHHFCIEIQYKNLPIITDLLAKSSFLKISFPCTFSISAEQKTNDEPRTNQGTPKELPILKKCCLLRFGFILRSSLFITPQSHWGTKFFSSLSLSIPPVSYAAPSISPAFPPQLTQQTRTSIPPLRQRTRALGAIGIA